MRPKKDVRTLIIIILYLGFIGCMRPNADGARAIFRGSTGPIFCVAYSPDGRLLALGTGGFDARIWEAASGRELAVFEGHTSGVSSIAFSPDGGTVAVGSWDKTVSLWDVADMKRKATLECGEQVWKVAYASNGKLFAATGGRRMVKLWDLTEVGPKERVTLKTDTCGMTFAPEGDILITVGEDGSVKTWDAKTGQVRTVVQGIGGEFSVTAISSDGRMLALASDSSVFLANSNGVKLTILTRFNASVNCLAFSPDGKTLAAGGSDETVKFWDVSNGRELAILAGHTGRINSVAFSPDGKTLASVSDDRTVRLWDVPRL